MLRPLVLLACLSSALSAQVTYTKGCFTGLVVNGSPVTGQSVNLDLSTNGPVTCDFSGCAYGVLVLGSSSTSYRGVPLPVMVGTCPWLVSPDVMIPLGIIGTWWPGIIYQRTIPLAIPNHAALVGLTVHAQWWQWGEHRGRFQWVSGSRAAHIKIQ